MPLIHKHAVLGLLTLAVLAPVKAQERTGPVRLAVVGLVHGHVDGFLRAAKGRTDIQIVGVSELDAALRHKYAAKFGLSESLFFADLGKMLEQSKPEAVASFTSTFDHPAVVAACSKHKIHVMMEKPLAVDVAGAQAIQRDAKQGGIQVIVNYETTWYRSHGAMWQLLKQQTAAGEIRKMVAMDGHEGPKEIGVGPEFLGWLTDPVKNGAGALFDFGCYGANLMTWLMDNQLPVAVTAMTQRMKPQVYPNVDDEATILIEYPRAQGIVQASWNWPFGRKDFEVYAEKGYANAVGGGTLKVRLPGMAQEELRTPPELPEMERDSITYLASVVRGKLRPAGLSSLENNLIVTEILSAARESAKTGKRVTLR